MKNFIRSALDTLHALDFRLDHKDRELRSDRWIYSHANDPDTRLHLNIHMSEQAARTVVQRAKQIVGLATVGAEKPAVKTNHRQKMERATESRRRESVRQLADARAEKDRARRLAADTERRRDELADLLEGRGGISTKAVDPLATYTVEQVADLTGCTDKVVWRAINADTLTAYQCGPGPGGVRVRGADVHLWLTGVGR